MKKFYIILVVVVLIGSFAILEFLPSINTKAATPTGQELYGYAWIPNLGWANFNRCDYTDYNNPVCSGPEEHHVSVNSADGKLSGYAWIPNVGRLEFKQESYYPLSGESAKLKTNGSLVGWAKIVSFDSDTECPIGINCANNINDGWINFNSAGLNNVVFNNITNTASGYAWGGNSVGWINFSKVKMTPIALTLPSVNLTTPKVVVNIGEDIILSWTGTNLEAKKCSLSEDSGLITEHNLETSVPAKNLGSMPDPISLNFTISCLGTNGQNVSDKQVINVYPSCVLPEVWCTNTNKCIPNPCDPKTEIYTYDNKCSCGPINPDNPDGGGVGNSKVKKPGYKEN